MNFRNYLKRKYNKKNNITATEQTTKYTNKKKTGQPSIQTAF